MDYEKKYKEALERAKAEAIDGYLDAVALETIFPELKESEDERIRKALVDLVYSDVNELIGGVEKHSLMRLIYLMLESSIMARLCVPNVRQQSLRMESLRDSAISGTESSQRSHIKNHIGNS